MYATQTDLEERFGAEELIELTDRADPPTGAIDATVAARALTDAGNLIDGYVAKRYDLPLASTPPLLTQLACDIARWQLYDDAPSEAVKDRYRDAVSTLKQISTGAVELDIAGTPPAETGGPEVSAPDRIFTRDTLGGF